MRLRFQTTVQHRDWLRKLGRGVQTELRKAQLASEEPSQKATVTRAPSMDGWYIEVASVDLLGRGNSMKLFLDTMPTGAAPKVWAGFLSGAVE